jgi:hypothetical protein
MPMLNFSPSPTAAVALLAIISSFTLSGCSRPEGPTYELADVTGTVMMDGAPIAGVEVIFEPIGNGSLSFGTTDAKGQYQLHHNIGVEGCGLGEHRVRLNKMGEPGTPDDTKNLLPSRYNEKSEFTANVKAGKNTFDFELKSDRNVPKKGKGR